jgi:hypothetical protein
MARGLKGFAYLFDDCETRRMGEALTIACEMAEAHQCGPSGDFCQELAAAVLEVATFDGIVDSALMARAAMNPVFIDELASADLSRGESLAEDCSVPGLFD